MLESVRLAVADAATLAPEQAVARLEPFLADLSWLGALVLDWATAMQADPMALPALQATRNSALSNLVLVATPRISLVITQIAGVATRAPEIDLSRPAVRFAGQHGLYRLLTAAPLSGKIAQISAEASHCRSRDQMLLASQVLTLDERREALWLAPPARTAMLLRATIKHSPAAAIRSFSLADGAPIGTIHGDEGFARSAMLMSVLRALDLRAAAPILREMLADLRGQARWTVMRELIVLDPALAWPMLEDMAANDDDPALRTVAHATLQRLGTRLPPQREGSACPG
jgi:hypothetical protein